ncbi:MAG: hypothetical protein ACRENX_11460, partial [Candidatus Dormibacteria bacterium]
MTNRRGRLSGEGSSQDKERWSTRRKMEVVLRVLRGEDLDSLSRELRVTAAAMAHWRDQTSRSRQGWPGPRRGGAAAAAAAPGRG